MYIIICEIDHQSKFDARNRALKLVHWDDPKGWDGEGGGRGVQDRGDTCTPMVDSCQYMAKTSTIKRVYTVICSKV